MFGFSFWADAESVSENGLISGISNVSGMLNTSGSVWVPNVIDFFGSGFIFVGRVCVSLLDVFGFR